jgi:hypothetical protein
MKQEEEEKWVSAFRECLEDYSEPPMTGGWKRLERELSPLPVGSLKHSYFMYASAAAVILLLMTSAAIILFLGFSPSKYTETAKLPEGLELMTNTLILSGSGNADSHEKNSTTSGSVTYKNTVSSVYAMVSKNTTSSDFSSTLSDKGTVAAGKNAENSQQENASKLNSETNAQSACEKEKVNKGKSETSSSKDRTTEDNNSNNLQQQNLRKVPRKAERETELRETYRKKSKKNFSLGFIAGNNLFTDKGAVGDIGLVGAPGGPTPLEWEHHMPVSLGLSVRKQLSKRFALESGVTYTRLESEAVTGHDRHYSEFKQTLHYVGIPLKLNYLFLDKRYVTLYLSGGGMVEKSVSGKAKTIEHPAEITSLEDLNVKRPQWSVNGALGAQFNVNKQFGIFAEPGVIYYFDDKSEIETIRKKTPFNFNLQLGLRVTY